MKHTDFRGTFNVCGFQGYQWANGGKGLGQENIP